MSEEINIMDEMKPCPHCGGQILAVARKCKHCKQWLVPQDTTSSGGEGFVMSPEAPPGAVDGGCVSAFAADWSPLPEEQMFFFQETHSFTGPEAGMAGFFPTCYHLMISNRRVLAIAKDKKGKVASNAFHLDQVKIAQTTQKTLTHFFEMVVADPGERLVNYKFGAAVKQEWVAAAVDFISRCKGGFEKTQNAMTTGQLQQASKPAAVPEKLDRGELVIIGTPPAEVFNRIQASLSGKERLLLLFVHKGCYLALTTEAVLIQKTGFAYTASFGGVRTKSFEYPLITAVDLKKGLILSHLEISAAGLTEAKNDSAWANMERENVFQFDSDDYPTMELVARKIRQLMRESRAPKAAEPAKAAEQEDIPTKIKKLAELKEAGILTPEEFQKKKDELLSRM